MSGEIALDTSAAVRFLNGDATTTERILALPEVTLPMVVVGELFDVWIAAQCLEHGWVLVTDDTDFDYVDGLILKHW